MLILSLMALTVLVPLFLGAPIAAALGGAGAFWLVLKDPLYLRGAANALWNTADNYILVSVPLFLLMGEVIQRAQMTRRFYRAMALALGWLPGGLLHANIGACAIFAAVSGSSVATAATVGAASAPELIRLRYNRRLLFGSLAAGGTLGILIPPSIPLIVYAALVDQSVGRLFMAGVVPGLMMYGLFAAYITWRGIRDPGIAPSPPIEERGERPTALAALIDVMPVIIIFAVILGGLYFGWATPTEVAALGVAIAVAVAAIYRTLSWNMMREAIAAAVRFTSLIVFVIIGAQIFSYALFTWGLNREVAGWVQDMTLPPLVVLLLLVVMYIILGMFIESISMMVMTIGVVYPLVTGLGYDPIWFGVVLVILLEIGLITPPVGINLFTIQGLVPGETTEIEVARGSLPFLGLLLFGIGLLIAFPGIALWLPNLLYN